MADLRPEDIERAKKLFATGAGVAPAEPVPAAPAPPKASAAVPPKATPRPVTYEMDAKERKAAKAGASAPSWDRLAVEAGLAPPALMSKLAPALDAMERDPLDMKALGAKPEVDPELFLRVEETDVKRAIRNAERSPGTMDAIKGLVELATPFKAAVQPEQVEAEAKVKRLEMANASEEELAQARAEVAAQKERTKRGGVNVYEPRGVVDTLGDIDRGGPAAFMRDPNSVITEEQVARLEAAAGDAEGSVSDTDNTDPDYDVADGPRTAAGSKELAVTLRKQATAARARLDNQRGAMTTNLVVELGAPGAEQARTLMAQVTEGTAPSRANQEFLARFSAWWFKQEGGERAALTGPERAALQAAADAQAKRALFSLRQGGWWPTEISEGDVKGRGKLDLLDYVKAVVLPRAEATPSGQSVRTEGPAGYVFNRMNLPISAAAEVYRGVLGGDMDAYRMLREKGGFLEALADFEELPRLKKWAMADEGTLEWTAAWSFVWLGLIGEVVTPDGFTALSKIAEIPAYLATADRGLAAARAAKGAGWVEQVRAVKGAVASDALQYADALEGSNPALARIIRDRVKGLVGLTEEGRAVQTKLGDTPRTGKSGAKQLLRDGVRSDNADDARALDSLRSGRYDEIYGKASREAIASLDQPAEGARAARSADELLPDAPPDATDDAMRVFGEPVSAGVARAMVTADDVAAALRAASKGKAPSAMRKLAANIITLLERNPELAPVVKQVRQRVSASVTAGTVDMADLRVEMLRRLLQIKPDAAQRVLARAEAAVAKRAAQVTALELEIARRDPARKAAAQAVDAKQAAVNAARAEVESMKAGPRQEPAINLDGGPTVRAGTPSDAASLEKTEPRIERDITQPGVRPTPAANEATPVVRRAGTPAVNEATPVMRRAGAQAAVVKLDPAATVVERTDAHRAIGLEAALEPLDEVKAAQRAGRYGPAERLHFAHAGEPYLRPDFIQRPPMEYAASKRAHLLFLSLLREHSNDLATGKYLAGADALDFATKFNLPYYEAWFTPRDFFRLEVREVGGSGKVRSYGSLSRQEQVGKTWEIVNVKWTPQAEDFWKQLDDIAAANPERPRARAMNEYLRSLLPWSDPLATAEDVGLVRLSDTVFVRNPEVAKQVGPLKQPVEVLEDGVRKIRFEDAVSDGLSAEVVGFKDGKVMVQPMEFVDGSPRRSTRHGPVAVSVEDLAYMERGRVPRTREGRKFSYVGPRTDAEWRELRAAEDRMPGARSMRYKDQERFLELNPPKRPTAEEFDFPVSQLDPEAREAAIRAMDAAGRARGVPTPRFEDGVKAAPARPATPAPVAAPPQASPVAGGTGLAELGGAGAAISDNLYVMLLDKARKGDVLEGGQRSLVLQMAVALQRQGVDLSLDVMKRLAQEVMAIRGQNVTGGAFQQAVKDALSRVQADVAKAQPSEGNRVAPAVVSAGNKDREVTEATSKVDRIEAGAGERAGAKLRYAEADLERAQNTLRGLGEGLPADIPEVMRARLAGRRSALANARRAQAEADAMARASAQVRAEMRGALKLEQYVRKGTADDLANSARHAALVKGSGSVPASTAATPARRIFESGLYKTLDRYGVSGAGPAVAELHSSLARTLSKLNPERFPTPDAYYASMIVRQGDVAPMEDAHRLLRQSDLTDLNGKPLYRAVSTEEELAQVVGDLPEPEIWELDHYSVNKDLDVLRSDAHGKYGTQRSSEFNPGNRANDWNYLGRVMFYPGGAKPESMIAYGAQQKYTTQIRARIYDFKTDPRKIFPIALAAYRKMEAMPYRERMKVRGYGGPDPFNEFERLLVDLGYDGYKWPMGAPAGAEPTIVVTILNRDVPISTGVFPVLVPNGPLGAVRKGSKLDVSPDVVGVLNRRMTLAQAEVALRAPVEEHAVLFVNGTQAGRWGPEQTRAAGHNPRNSCAIDTAVLEQVRGQGAVFTHNHPNGGILSPEDLAVASFGDLGEMRAVPSGEKGWDDAWFVQRPVEGWASPAAIHQAWSEAGKKAFAVARRQMTEFIVAAGGDPYNGSMVGYTKEKWQQLLNDALEQEWRSGRYPELPELFRGFTRSELASDVSRVDAGSVPERAGGVQLPLPGIRTLASAEGADLGRVGPGLGQVRLPGGGTLADIHAQHPDAARGIFRQLGLRVEPGRATGAELRIYPLFDAFGTERAVVEERVRAWLNTVGWDFKVFGPDEAGAGFSPPNFRDFNYQNKNVWIFQPMDPNGSFRDYNYTLPWRVTHEVAHGLVNDAISDLYGGLGKRQGALGVATKFNGRDVPALTLADALRAVEWEAETFKEQRAILERDLGISITEEAFRQENGLNMSDAVWRAMTGGFSDPSDLGVLPTAVHPADVLRNARNTMRAAALEMGLDMGETFGIEMKAERAAQASADGVAWIVGEALARREAGATKEQFARWLTDTMYKARKAPGSSPWVQGVEEGARMVVQAAGMDADKGTRFLAVAWGNSLATADEIAGLNRRQYWQGMAVDRYPPDTDRLAASVRTAGENVDPEDIQGLIDFQMGQGIMTFYRTGNFSTVLHEPAHMLRRILPPDMLAELEQALGVVDGNWTRYQEEQFVAMWEKAAAGGFLSTGNPALDRSFRQVTNTLRAVAEDSGIAVSPTVQRLFDTLHRDTAGPKGPMIPGRGSLADAEQEQRALDEAFRLSSRSLLRATWEDRMGRLRQWLRPARDVLDGSLKEVVKNLIRKEEAELSAFNKRLADAITRTKTDPLRALVTDGDDLSVDFFAALDEGADGRLLDAAAVAFLDRTKIPLSSDDMRLLREALRTRGSMEEVVAALQEASLAVVSRQLEYQGRAMRDTYTGKALLTQAAGTMALHHRFEKAGFGVGAVLHSEDAKAASEWLAGTSRSDRGRQIVLGAMEDPFNYIPPTSGVAGLRREQISPFGTTGTKSRVGSTVAKISGTLEGSDVYVPRVVRDRLVAQIDAVEQAAQPPLGTKLLLRYWKQGLTSGVLLARPTYYLNNVFGDFDQIATVAGFDVAFRQSARNLAQNFLAVPGVANVLRLAGDAGTMRRVSDMLAWGSISKGVTKVMDGADEMIELGGKQYNARDLFRIGSSEGVGGVYSSAELQKDLAEVLRKRGPVGRAFSANSQAVRDVAELISLRQHWGLFLTLVDTGKEPREAAKMTIDALYDYVHGLHEVDKNVVLQLFQPFWNFQKNNARRTARAFLTPGVWGAGYFSSPTLRMKNLWLAKERGTELLSDYLDNRDMYGFDTEAMQTDDPAKYAAYQKAIAELEARGLSPKAVRELLSRGDEVPELDGFVVEYWNGDPTRAMLPDWLYSRFVAYSPYNRGGAMGDWLLRGEGRSEAPGDDWRAVPMPDDSNMAAIGQTLGAAAVLVNAMRALVQSDPGALARMSAEARMALGDPAKNPAVVFTLGTLLGYDVDAYARTLPPATGDLLHGVFGPRVSFANRVTQTAESSADSAEFANQYKMPAGTAALADMLGVLGPSLAAAGLMEKALGSGTPGKGPGGAPGYALAEGLLGQRTYPVSQRAQDERADREATDRVYDATAAIPRAAAALIPDKPETIRKDAREIETARLAQLQTGNPEQYKREMMDTFARYFGKYPRAADDVLRFRSMAVFAGYSATDVDGWDDDTVLTKVPELAKYFVPTMAARSDVR